MADLWPTACLSDLCDADRGITYGIVQPGSPQQSGVPIIRADDVDDGRISTSNLMRVSPDVEKRYLRSRIRGGEVLLTLVGAYFGKSAVTRQEHVGCNTARAVGVIPVLEDADFVSFALRSPKCQAFINERANTTAQPTLNLSDVANVPIPWPPQASRRQVTEVLRALDDRIELCEQMSRTLQLIAHAVFKDWFVDFGPVLAKLGGRTPYLASDIWQLFPDRLDKERKPEGWNVCRFGKFFQLERGLSYKGEYLTESGVPMINLGCFQGRGRFDATKIKPYSGDYRIRHKVKSGDLVLANTDMTQNRVILGSPHVVSADQGQEFIFSHHVYAARALDSEAQRWTRFFYFHLLRPEFRERAEGFATGTTVLFLPSDAVENCSFVLPTDEVYAAFLATIDPLLQRCAVNDRLEQTLRATRDLLLPKLTSGELRFQDAVKVIEAAL